MEKLKTGIAKIDNNKPGRITKNKFGRIGTIRQRKRWCDTIKCSL